MKDLSKIYSAAKAEIGNKQANSFKSLLKKYFMKNEIRQEYSRYKKASFLHQKQFLDKSRKWGKIYLAAAVAVLLLFIGLIAFIINSHSSDGGVNSSTIADSAKKDGYAESLHGYSVCDCVKYSGTVYYTKNDSNEFSRSCKGGPAIITGIDPKAIHPFHLVSAGEPCTVYGWVDEEFIKKQ